MGVNLGNYKFDKYKTKKQDKKVENIELLTLTDDSDLDEAINMAEIISNSMNFTKDLVFESAEIMTPNKVSEIATDLAKNYGIRIKVYNKDELKKWALMLFLQLGKEAFKSLNLFT